MYKRLQFHFLDSVFLNFNSGGVNISELSVLTCHHPMSTLHNPGILKALFQYKSYGKMLK